MANNYKTDVNHVKQQNQKAEANKQYASGSANSMKSMDVEFGTETDVNHVKQQNQKAEANKKNASGNYANENNTK